MTSQLACCKSQDSAGGIGRILRVVPIAKVRVAETACPPRYLCRFQPQNPGIYNIGEPLKVISQNDRIKNPLGIYSNVVQPVIMPSYELSVRIKEQVSECLPRTDHLQFHTALQKSQ